MAEQDAPKIIVDTDWKSQAQAEKDRLAAADKAKTPAKPSAPGAPPGMEDEGAPPEPTFTEIVRMLATQALMYMGAFPDPESGRRFVSLELAQFNIELLTALETKTKGNLTAEENTFLTRMLYELRMQFVEISKMVARAVEEGKIRPGGQPLGGPGAMPDLNIQPKPR